MAIETERRFLIKKELWLKVHPQKSVFIRQAYLVTRQDILLRIRTINNKGYITIKGKATGISRPEYEYEIPIEEANQLINDYSKYTIEKIRHYVIYENKTWEVDEFKELNEGLLIAEIELTSVKEQFKIPEWIGEEISLDYRYCNSNLSHKPYQTW